MRKLTIVSAILLAFSPAVSAGDHVSDTLGFDRMNSVTPADMLRGKLSGVRISLSDGGASASVNTTVRGLNSFRESSEPLWIVDGTVLTVPCSRDLNPMTFVNPYDIESIEVLKDLSQTALYGAQGGNGVIIVKTRNAARDGVSARWNSNFGVASNGRAAFVHNHSVSAEGRKNRNSYRVSAFFRQHSVAVKGDGIMDGGLSVNFDSKANEKVWFGLSSILSIGRLDAQSRNYDSFAVDFDDYSRRFRTVDNAYLQINFLPSLKWRTSVGFDYGHDSRYVWYGNGTDLGKAVNGAASVMTSAIFGYNFSTKLSYDVHIAAEHHLLAEAGAGLYGNKDRVNISEGTDFFNHALRAKGVAFSGSKPVPDWQTVTLSHLHVGGRLSYAYADIVGLDLSVRAENIRRFDSGNFNLYPAAEAWFDIARLAGMKGAVSGLKLDAGYGVAGRDFFVPYSGLYIGTVPSGTESLYEGLDRNVSRELHAGITVSFASDRVSLGAKFYQKNTVDELVSYCLGEQIGESIRWRKTNRTEIGRDVAEVRGRGLEFDLRALAVSRGDFKWNVNANISFQSNQIVTVTGPTRFGDEVGEGIVPCYNEVGYPLSSLMGKAQNGLPAILGTPSPKMFGALQTVFSWRTLALGLDLDGAAGHQVLNMNRMLADGAGEVSAEYVEDASFLRLGSLSLAYGIPLKVKWLKELKLSLSGRNLCVATRYGGFNPDVDCFSGLPSGRGVDYGSFPLARTVILGVGLKF